MTPGYAHVDRWSGGLSATVGLAAAGVLLGSPTLVVAAVVPVTYVAYATLSRVDPALEELSVTRSLDRTSALPGDRIRVEVQVTNEGVRPVSDLRLVDRVPESVAVVEGSPRTGVALRPGETATLSYAVVARRGDHDFGPVRLRARSMSGADVLTVDAPESGPSRLVCRPDVESVPLATRTRQFVGEVGTDTGGSGVEFHSTREYRRGDPVNRVDWRRLAKSGELTTVDYREHRSLRVVVAVDARDPCYVSPVPGSPTGAAVCAHGATHTFERLAEAGHLVGATAFGLTDRSGPGGPAWIPPGRGEEVRLRARSLFDAVVETAPTDDARTPGLSPMGRERGGGSRRSPGSGRGPDPSRPDRARGTAPDGGTGEPSRGRPGTAAGRGGRTNGGADGGWSGRIDPVETLCDRLSADAQLLFFTPALDRFPVEVVRSVTARGHEVTVVTPDVTSDATRGGRLRRVERQFLVDDLREAGATVVDWDQDRPLALALATAVEGL